MDETSLEPGSVGTRHIQVVFNVFGKEKTTGPVPVVDVIFYLYHCSLDEAIDFRPSLSQRCKVEGKNALALHSTLVQVAEQNLVRRIKGQ